MTVLPIEQQAIRDRSKERQAEARKEWQTDPPTGPPDPKPQEFRPIPNPTKANLPAIADQLEALARRLRKQGDTTYARTAAWERGPLPGNGHRFEPGEDDEPPPLGNPDGKDDAAAARLHGKYRHGLHALYATARQVDAIITIAERIEDIRQIDTPQDAVAQGFCRSCYTYKRTLSEIYVDPEGRIRWKGLCGFCGRFKADHGHEPPRRILEVHHTPGMYVTTRLVEGVLAQRATVR